jgi:hypothetical protein
MALAIRQPFRHRRFVRDERVNTVGVAHGEGEPDQRAATAAENICRLFTDRREQQVRIVGMDLGPPRLGRSIESASRIASRIVRDERIALSKHRRDASEHVGVSGAARNREQHRARPRTW